MAWHRPGTKPLSEPIMFILLRHICHPNWVNRRIFNKILQNSLCFHSRISYEFVAKTSMLMGSSDLIFYLVPQASSYLIFIAMKITRAPLNDQAFKWSYDVYCSTWLMITYVCAVSIPAHDWHLAPYVFIILTHCARVLPCGDIDLGQHWLS